MPLASHAGPGRLTALAIAGVPLILLLMIGFTTAGDNSGTPSGYNGQSAQYPLGLNTSRNADGSGQGASPSAQAVTQSADQTTATASPSADVTDSNSDTATDAATDAATDSSPSRDQGSIVTSRVAKVRSAADSGRSAAARTPPIANGGSAPTRSQVSAEISTASSTVSASRSAAH